jgi:F-type H+-transporting ATPase subunit delta
MAELATIARPYAEALFEAEAGAGLADQLDAVGAVAADDRLQALAANPKATPTLVFSVFGDVLLHKGLTLAPPVANLLKAVIDNGRVGALPEIARQYRALLNARSGTFDATIVSAFPIGDAQVAEIMPALEKRFGRKLKPHVVEDRALIGGIRVVVGDEVLDTSVRARLEQMKAALSA